MADKLCAKWVSGVVVALLTGCASQPEDIATSYVSSNQYNQYNCEQLAMEATRVSRRVSELHGTLEKTANDDAAQMGVGLVLFWPVLFFLEGGDGTQAQEYARLKGERDAIQQSMTAKECSSSHARFLPIKQDPDTSPDSSIEERLVKLDMLLKEGLLTEEDAALKREEILSGL